MPVGAVCRIGDPISCGDHAGCGSPNVYANNIPITRLGDCTVSHTCGPVTVLQEGNSRSVYANNISISVVTSSIVPHGTCDDPPHGGIVSSGSPNVFVGT